MYLVFFRKPTKIFYAPNLSAYCKCGNVMYLVFSRKPTKVFCAQKLLTYLQMWLLSCLMQIDDVDVRKPRRTSRRSLETLSEQNQRSTQTSIRELPSEFETDSAVSSVVIADIFCAT